MKTFDKILNIGQSRVGGTRQLALQRESGISMSSSFKYKEDIILINYTFNFCIGYNLLSFIVRKKYIMYNTLLNSVSQTVSCNGIKILFKRTVKQLLIFIYCLKFIYVILTRDVLYMYCFLNHQHKLWFMYSISCSILCSSLSSV